MSYSEKKSIVLIVSGLLLIISYWIYISKTLGTNSVLSEDIQFWAKSILIFIGVGIGVIIIIQIVFHILLSMAICIKETIEDTEINDDKIKRAVKVEMTTDEMDQLIELKSLRVGYVIAGIGVMAAIISVVIQYSPALLMNLLFMSLAIGSLGEGIAQLIFYKRGV